MRSSRRLLTLPVLGLALALPLLGVTLPVVPAAAAVAAGDDPAVVLEQAQALADGDLTGPGTAGGLGALPGFGTLLARAAPEPVARGAVDGSQIQRELYRAADLLEGSERDRAADLLARPTDGRRDLVGDGYTVPSRRTCTVHVCVHWVPTTNDAPRGRAWVDRTLRVMERAWRTEVDDLGYRRPLADGGNGGDGRFDVYLKDVGKLGVYGYCTPEQRPGATRRTGTSAGYCVLDDDFAARQFGDSPPSRSLKVTAAHEFFHAIQLAYDVGTDAWFAESTAVWMEGRVFPRIRDNIRYLPFGQLDRPGRPLDAFQPTGFAQYGNWVFWERLSERFGNVVVRRVLTRSAERGSYSAAALRDVLAARPGGLSAALAEYGAALTAPVATYPGAQRWPVGQAPTPLRLDAATPRVAVTTRLDHLATTSYVAQPDAATDLAGTRLTVRVRGPRSSATAPAAHLRLVKAGGKVVDRDIPLSARGRGRTVVPFVAGGVRSVTVTLANASTRFRCQRGTLLSCGGTALDDDRRFRLVVSTKRS